MKIARSPIARLAVLFLLGSGAAALLFRSPLGPLLLSPEGRQGLLLRLDAAVRSAGPLGPLLFIVVMTVGLMALPATPFVAAGALLFGKVLGSACNLAAAMAAAALSFLAGRYLLRDLARGFLAGRLEELDRKAEAHGFTVIFLLRTLWFPFIVLNYGAGATRIRFRDYFLGTVLGGTAPFIVSSVFFGSIREVAATFRGPADLLRFDVLFPAGLLAFSLLLPGLVRRFREHPGTDAAPGEGT